MAFDASTGVFFSASAIVFAFAMPAAALAYGFTYEIGAYPPIAPTFFSCPPFCVITIVFIYLNKLPNSSSKSIPIISLPA